MLIQVEQDAGVSGSIERGGRLTRGPGGATAGDLDVDALGVRLSVVGLASAVECDDLVAEDIVARSHARGDGDGPRVAVGHELVGRPGAGVGARDEAGLGDLGEGEEALVDGGAVAAAARGEVVDDGAAVGLGPGVPDQGHAAAGGDLGGDGGAVADLWQRMSALEKPLGSRLPGTAPGYSTPPAMMVATWPWALASAARDRTVAALRGTVKDGILQVLFGVSKGKRRDKEKDK